VFIVFINIEDLFKILHWDRLFQGVRHSAELAIFPGDLPVDY